MNYEDFCFTPRITILNLERKTAFFSCSQSFKKYFLSRRFKIYKNRITNL